MALDTNGPQFSLSKPKCFNVGFPQNLEILENDESFSSHGNIVAFLNLKKETMLRAVPSTESKPP